MLVFDKFFFIKFTCSGFCAPETPVTPGKRKAETKKEKGTPPAKKVKTDGEGETCILYTLFLVHLTTYDDQKGLNTDVCDVTFL